MAKGRIEGITIEINGETAKLKDSLKNIDSSLKQTSTALKDVNRLLKFDGNNTTLLSQKQEKLKQAINDTKDRLGVLKEAQKQWADKAKDGNQEAQKNYEAVTREIIATEQELKKLERQLQNTMKPNLITKVGDGFKEVGSRITAAGESVKKFGDNISGVGRALTPLSGAVVAVGKKSLDYAKTLNQAYDQVIHKTGATGQAAEEYRNIVKDVFRNTEFDAQQVADAVGAVGVRFKDLDISKVSTDFLKFSKVTGVDTKTAVEKVSRVLTANGRSVKDYGKMLDQLTYTQQQTGKSVEDLLGSLDKYGSGFRNAGFSLEESIAMLGQFESRGVDVNKALMALQTGGGRALKEIGNAKKVVLPLFKQLSDGKMTVDEVKNAMERLGVRGGGALIDAFQNAGVKYEDFAKILESSNVDGTLEKTYNEGYDGMEKLKTAFDDVKTSLSEFGQALADGGLTSALEKVSDYIKRISDAFKNLPEDKQKQIITTLMAIAAAAPVLMFAGKGISLLGGAISIIGSVASGLGSAMTAIGGAVAGIGAIPALIIGAVVAVVAFFGVLYAKSESFRNTVNTSFGAIFDTIKNVWERLKPVFETFINTVIPLFQNLWEQIKGIIERLVPKINGVIEALTPIVQSAIEFIGKIIETVVPLIQNVIQHIIPVISAIIEYIGGILETVIPIIQGLIEKVTPIIQTIFDFIVGAIKFLVPIIQTIVGVISRVIQTIITIVTPIVQWIITVVGGIISTIISIISGIIGFISGVINTIIAIIRPIVQTVGAIITALWTVISTIFNGIKNTVVTIWNGLKNTVITVVTGLKNGVLRIWNFFKDLPNTVKTAVNNVVNKVKELPNKIYEQLGNLKNKALTWGRDMLQGFIDGIQEKVGQLYQKVRDIGGGIKRLIGFSVPEAGPLSDADTYMPDMIDLFIKGIVDNQKRLFATAASMAQRLKGNMGLNPQVINSLNTYSNTSPINLFEIHIGNKEIKDFTVEAVTSTINNQMRSLNMSRGVM